MQKWNTWLERIENVTWRTLKLKVHCEGHILDAFMHFVLAFRQKKTTNPTHLQTCVRFCYKIVYQWNSEEALTVLWRFKAD